MCLRIDISDRQREMILDGELVRRILKDVLSAGGVERAELSLAIVADRDIRQINERFLGKDEITDVIAFVYDKSEEGRFLEGEIVINASEAVRYSGELAHDAAAELLFYAVHGALHLLGWEDDSPQKRDAMNRKAAGVLAGYGMRLNFGRNENCCRV